MSVDAFGIYRNNADEQLSRVDQFKFMRNSKPLRLLRANAGLVVIGSSRGARLSPSSAGIHSGFNSALPGATTHEESAILSMAASLDTSRTVIIGLDFDAFLSIYPRVQPGFHDQLVQPVQKPAHHLAKLVALKHLFFSPIAIHNAYLATHAENGARGAVYRHDGSWNRPRDSYKSGDFRKLSRQKLDSYDNAGTLSLEMDAYRRMLVTCHEQQQISCHFVVTPVHLFHIGILEQAGVIDLWREWHHQIVQINHEVAQSYQLPPLPLWGFNNFDPAVGQHLSSRQNQPDPWFLDNVHFRPRFGTLMLKRMLDLPGAESDSAGVVLDETNVQDYLDSVAGLAAEFRRREARVIGKLYELLGLPWQMPQEGGDT